jgi:hypothetical protein
MINAANSMMPLMGPDNRPMPNPQAEQLFNTAMQMIAGGQPGIPQQGSGTSGPPGLPFDPNVTRETKPLSERGPWAESAANWAAKGEAPDPVNWGDVTNVPKWFSDDGAIAKLFRRLGWMSVGGTDSVSTEPQQQQFPVPGMDRVTGPTLQVPTGPQAQPNVPQRSPVSFGTTPMFGSLPGQARQSQPQATQPQGSVMQRLMESVSNFAGSTAGSVQQGVTGAMQQGGSVMDDLFKTAGPAWSGIATGGELGQDIQGLLMPLLERQLAPQQARGQHLVDIREQVETQKLLDMLLQQIQQHQTQSPEQVESQQMLEMLLQLIQSHQAQAQTPTL